SAATAPSPPSASTTRWAAVSVCAAPGSGGPGSFDEGLMELARTLSRLLLPIALLIAPDPRGAAAQKLDPADCTGLVPTALPAGFDIVLGDSLSTACEAEGTDGAGAVLLSTRHPGGTGPDEQHFY